MIIGSTVKLKCTCLNNPKGTFGIVYETYADFDVKNGIAVSVIFENGEYCGFSAMEQSEFFEYIKDVDFSYNFTNVMKLSRDYDSGVFDKIFEELRK